MKCTGITAEYNPFHNGHAYHLSKTRSIFPENKIAVVMSGNFVQRGDIAIFDKFYRTEMALKAGVDIVIELPVVFAVSCAERFAKAAVGIFEKSNIVDSVSFGSESADIDNLFKLANASGFEDEASKQKLKEALNLGMSFAKAQSEAFSLPASPNDILGIEYIKAIKSLSSNIRPIAIQRIGAMHDKEESTAKGFLSASAIRTRILSGELDYNYSPVSSDTDEFSSAILFALRSKSKEELSRLPDVSEGLENVIYSACRKARSYSEFLSLSKSKRYTLSRLRRIAICALLSITNELQASALNSPDDYFYIKVLGIKKESASLLSELSKNSEIPVITSFKDTEKLSQNARKLFEKDLLASDIYNIFAEKSAESDYTKQLIIV